MFRQQKNYCWRMVRLYIIQQQKFPLPLRNKLRKCNDYPFKLLNIHVLNKNNISITLSRLHKLKKKRYSWTLNLSNIVCWGGNERRSLIWKRSHSPVVMIQQLSWPSVSQIWSMLQRFIVLILKSILQRSKQ